MTRAENALCVHHCLKSERDEINASARLRSCLSDEPPSESHSALFHMSTPQGTPSPALCKVHQKTNSFSADLKWGLREEEKIILFQTTEIHSSRCKLQDMLWLNHTHTHILGLGDINTQ